MTEQNSSDYYTAAVVEFSPTYHWHDAALTLRKNTNAYIEYIEKASKQVSSIEFHCVIVFRNMLILIWEFATQGADIIVFPEDGLTSIYLPDKSQMDSWTTVIPSAVDEYIPCTGTDVNVSEVSALYARSIHHKSLSLFLVDAKKTIMRCKGKSHLRGGKYRWKAIGQLQRCVPLERNMALSQH